MGSRKVIPLTVQWSTVERKVGSLAVNLRHAMFLLKASWCASAQQSILHACYSTPSCSVESQLCRDAGLIQFSAVAKLNRSHSEGIGS